MKVSSKKIGVFLAQKLSEKGVDTKDAIKETAFLLFKTGKISKLSTVLKNFNTKWNEINNELDVTISSPVPDSVKFPKEIKGKKVNLYIKEDKSLIAGVEVKIKDYILKDSIKSRLQAIRNISK